jgi:hypothetical protein
LESENRDQHEDSKETLKESREPQVILDPVDFRGKFMCPLCNEVFETQPDYVVHAKNQHNEDTSVSTSIY